MIDCDRAGENESNWHICIMTRQLMLIGLIIISGIGSSAVAQISVVRDVVEESDKPAIITTAIDPKREDNYAIVFSDGDVINTTDAGKNWATTHLEEITSGSKWVFSDKKGTLYGFDMSGGEFSAYSSSDLGNSWKALGAFSFQEMEGEPGLNYHPEKGQLYLSYVQNTDCNVKVLFQQSKNTKKWSDPVILNGKGVSCENSSVSAADITVGYQGFVYALWWQNNQRIVDRSFDNGDTWLRSDIKFKDVLGNFEYGRPRIRADRSLGQLRGAIYALWVVSNEGSPQILATRSGNHGDYWGPSVPVSGEDSGMFPVFRVDQGNGILYAAYWKPLENDAYDIMLAYSLDGAQTFKRVKINDAPVSATQDHMKRSLAMSVRDNRIVLAWASDENGKRKVYSRVTTYSDISETD